MFPCYQLIAASLDLPAVGIHAAQFLDPLMSSSWQWQGSYRGTGVPNPLAITPQLNTGLTEHMVRLASMFVLQSWVRVLHHCDTILQHCSHVQDLECF